MRKNITRVLSALAFASLLNGCSANGVKGSEKPEITKMKCEFVADGDTAYIYGHHLEGVQVIFPGDLASQVLPGSNDSVLSVVVPKGASTGKLTFTVKNDTTFSSFIFRDKRNILIDFDSRLSTWGAFEPYGDEGELITEVLDGDSVVKMPTVLPEGCDNDYALLYGKYNKSWDMKQSLWVQYVANPLEGGRGNKSIAGDFVGYPISQLALKFEVFIPKGCPYKGIRTEIFFGPQDAPDKHGRDRSPLYFWKPFEATGSYATDGWETVTIPLSEFTHGIHTDSEKFPTPIDLKKATNFTFLLFGDAEAAGNPNILMCVDNFRVVPISE